MATSNAVRGFLVLMAWTWTSTPESSCFTDAFSRPTSVARHSATTTRTDYQQTENSNSNQNSRLWSQVEDKNEEQLFKEEIASLCNERNLPLEQVKNCRDLSAPQSSPIVPGRIYRTGRLGDASQKDCGLLFDTIGITTLVDLRSPTELRDDDSLMANCFDDFTDLVWIENGRRRDGCLRELAAGVSPVEKSRKRWLSRNGKSDPSDDLAAEDEMCDVGCDDPNTLPAQRILTAGKGRKERHFVSLMNEFKYVRGTVTKLRKRDIAKAIIKAPGAFLSKRIWNSLKEPFITEINSESFWLR